MLSRWSQEDLVKIFITDSTEYGILLADREGQIEYSNTAAESILGYRPEEIKTKYFCDLFLRKEGFLSKR